MAAYRIIWNEEPGGNVEHIAEHGLSPDDVEDVLAHPIDQDVSRSSGLPIAFGFTADGRYVLVVYEQVRRVYIVPGDRLRGGAIAWPPTRRRESIERQRPKNAPATPRFVNGFHTSYPTSKPEPEIDWPI